MALALEYWTYPLFWFPEQIKRRVSRMIDAYEHELLTREEFESRVATARRQLAEAESELAAWREQTRDQAELQNVIGAFEDFRRRIEQGLSNPDAATRQAIVRALVKRVEIDGEHVRVVYRVHPTVPTQRPPETTDQPPSQQNTSLSSDVSIKVPPAPETGSSLPWSFPYCSLRQRDGGHEPRWTLSDRKLSNNQKARNGQKLPAVSAGAAR